ncbi:unnamed protein product [Porites evermanni]|uniref:Uncharacterized protein n=1 Tax=Porites evermanni TaxID=104178 RepID=A0ABN8MGU2_9CNID|nr:unnamed protein product [Porites evermanni]
MKTFVKKRIQTNEVSYWDAIPKLGIKTFSSMTKKVKVKAGDEKSITVHADRDLFGRLRMVANARQINLMEVLSYELSPIPCSLAHQDGSLRKNTKSHLAGIIEKLVTVVPQLQPSPENTVYILDGMAVIQMIKSGRTATFGELAKHYFNTFTSPLSTHKCYCVHVVFDQYLDDSIKAGERTRRGSHLRESTQLVIGGGFKDGERCVAITRDSCVDVEDLKSNQEEADTRMLLHAKYAAGQCQEAKIVIQSPDTDVLVLSAAHFEDIASKELWFRTGVKDRLRFVPVHDVCQNLSNRVLKALPAFHALTGCDTTSALSGIGKKKPWNVFIRSAVHQESLTILGQQPEVDEVTAKKCEAFICDLYPSYKKSPKTADELRYIIFCQKKPNSEALPPTSASLRQHINRANY